jgi:hypothetical protein
MMVMVVVMPTGEMSVRRMRRQKVFRRVELAQVVKDLRKSSYLITWAIDAYNAYYASLLRETLTFKV